MTTAAFPDVGQRKSGLGGREREREKSKTLIDRVAEKEEKKRSDYGMDQDMFC